jgi:hypothetical protein
MNPWDSDMHAVRDPIAISIHSALFFWQPHPQSTVCTLVESALEDRRR